jgi:hypothetical protein
MTKCGCFLTTAAAYLFVNSANADTPGFAGGGFTTEQPASFTGTKGWSFYNGPNNPIAITQLGIFDSGGDGLASSHQIGLWATDGTLLASAIVPAGLLAPLVDGYRYAPIAPVTLPGGFGVSGGYIIAAQYFAGDTDDLLTPVSGGLAAGLAVWQGGFPSIGWYDFGSELPFPSQRTNPLSEGTLGPPFWEPNFQFVAVPEPSVWFLVSPALAFVVIYRRRFARG